MNSQDCIFCKIVNKELPANVVYENDTVMAFLDITPVNLGHTLVVPKEHSTNIFDISDNAWIEVMQAVKKIAPAVKEGTKACGINIGMNNNLCAGQVVMHPHVHIMPRFENDGRELWHGKEVQQEDLKDVLENIMTYLND